MAISDALSEHLRVIAANEHPAHRFTLAASLIRACRVTERESRLIRNEAVRALCAEVLADGKPRGPSATARLTGMALPTVKGINAGGSDDRPTP